MIITEIDLSDDMKNGKLFPEVEDQFPVKKVIGGNKKDEGKLRYDLIPADVYEEIAKVFTFGATKYGDRNWEEGIDYTRLVAAAKRHIESYLLHEQTDAECGTHHLANAIANLMMIIHFDRTGVDPVHQNLPLRLVSSLEIDDHPL